MPFVLTVTFEGDAPLTEKCGSALAAVQASVLHVSVMEFPIVSERGTYDKNPIGK
jgi:hypothetical protein